MTKGEETRFVNLSRKQALKVLTPRESTELKRLAAMKALEAAISRERESRQNQGALRICSLQ